MTRARAYSAMLTSHELMLLALYRALTRERQRELAGLVYRSACEATCVVRFRDEAAAVGAEKLEGSVLRPFIEASRDVQGVWRRVA